MAPLPEPWVPDLAFLLFLSVYQDTGPTCHVPEATQAQLPGCQLEFCARRIQCGDGPCRIGLALAQVVSGLQCPFSST